MMMFMSRRGIRRSAAVAVLAALSLASVLSVDEVTAARIPVRLPPPGGQFDYQLGGSYPPPQGTVIVSRDRTDKPATGAYNICYINAYQTQPEATSWWRQHHPELLLRNKLATVLYTWIDGCARSAADAILT